jgi:hypothetical protein
MQKNIIEVTQVIESNAITYYLPDSGDYVIKLTVNPGHTITEKISRHEIPEEILRPDYSHYTKATIGKLVNKDIDHRRIV